MKHTKMIRRLGDLGRIAIPKEIRNVLGLKENDELEIFVDSETKQIIMKPVKFK